MHGEPIAELNSGLVTLKDELMADTMAMQRVEMAVVSFGPVHVHSDFQSPDTRTPPNLQTSGDTPMGAAIEQGLQMLEARKQVYRHSGITYYRPWVFLITDGGPTDSWRHAASLIHAGDNDDQKSFSFFVVGVEGANMDILAQISRREPLKLKGLRFRDFKLAQRGVQVDTWNASPASTPHRPLGLGKCLMSDGG
jgi:uncharacterized protein YegL